MTNILTPFGRAQSSVSLPEKFERFKDLLYVPLDLPDVPEIDMDELLTWSMNVSPDHPNQRGSIELPDGKTILTPEQATRNRFGYYPWQSIWMKRSSEFVPENNGWMLDFIEKFPALAEYVNNYPLKEISAVNLMWQKQDNSVMIHSDPEHWFGMRLYLANQETSPLYFMQTHKPLNERIDFVTTDINDEKLKQIADTNKRYIKYLKPAHPWIINNVRAFHGVEPSSDALGTRAVIVIHGKFVNGESPLDFDKLYDLLNRSVAKYPDYCVWRMV